MSNILCLWINNNNNHGDWTIQIVYETITTIVGRGRHINIYMFLKNLDSI